MTVRLFWGKDKGGLWAGYARPERSATGFATPSLTFAVCRRVVETWRTGLQAPSGFGVFNIGGNKYRLIARIHYNRKKVYIQAVLTHQEYDRGSWKQKK